MNRLILILLAGVAAAPGMALAGSGDLVAFKPRAAWRTGAAPGSVAIADVNRDGKPDLVVANSDDGTASVLYGRGDGYFLTRTNYDAGGNARIVVDDINHDGKPDILSINGEGVGFLRGNGGGTFQAPVSTTLLVQGTPSNGVMAVGDFNGDGRLDVVVAFAEFGFFLSLGDGRGGFGPLSSLGSDGFADVPFTVDAAGDGSPDLITQSDSTASEGFVSSLHIGASGQSIAFPNTAAADVKTADVNFDGKPDLICALGNGKVAVSLGVGGGRFGTPQYYPVGIYPQALVVADMNRDGKRDLVVVNYSSNTVSVLRGNGDGTFAARQDFPTGNNPSSLAVADVNGDGFPDIVVTDAGDNTVSVLLGTAP